MRSNKQPPVTNYVEARGRVIGIGRDGYGNKRFVLFIRGMQQRRAIYASFAMPVDVAPGLQVQDQVEVKGHVVAYLFENELWNNRNTYTQYMVADEVIQDKTEIEKAFGYKKGFAYEDPYIRIFLQGEVSNQEVNREAGWTTTTIKIETEEEERDHEVQVQYSKNMRVADVKYQLGDTVCVVANLSSKRKNINGEVRNFEDFIVDDIAIIDARERRKKALSAMEEALNR